MYNSGDKNGTVPVISFCDFLSFNLSDPGIEPGTSVLSGPRSNQLS